MIFTQACNLSRHKKICLEKKTIVDELTNKNEALKQKDEALKQKDETISVLKSEVDYLKTIINNSGSIIKTSMSTLAYVIKNYKEAPAIGFVYDYSALHYEQSNAEFAENLIHEHNHNKLHTYIGNFIIKTQQSIWNSDTNRLTYIIREIITNKTDWKIDKKGIKTNEYIIKPVLEYIDE